MALFPKAKLVTNGPLDWRPLSLGRSPGVERFLTGRDPSFCVVFYPVLFCTLTFPVVGFFSLHLITKVGLCCSVSLPLISAPN